MQASATEAFELRELNKRLQAQKVPELAELLETALRHERAQMEAQSQKALAVLEAKDDALFMWEKESHAAREAERASNTALNGGFRVLGLSV